MQFFLIIALAIAFDAASSPPRVRNMLDSLGRRLQAAVSYRLALPAVGGLVASFLLEILLLVQTAHAALPHVAWLSRLPIPTVYSYPVNYVSQFARTAFAVISVFQTLLTAVFLLATTKERWGKRETYISAIAACIIAAIAVLSPNMSTADMYAYVGYSLLGLNHAYAPPATALPGDFAIIHRMWNLPLMPAAYGPVWVWFNSATLSLVAGFHAKLIVLRVVNVTALAVVLETMRRLGVSPRFIAAVAVSPALAFYFVVSAHNDLVPIAILLTAMTFADRWPLAAGIVAGIGASFKLTLVVPAATVALIIVLAPRRWLYIASMTATAALIAALIGGKPYFDAMHFVTLYYADKNGFISVRVLHIAVACATLAAVIAAISVRRTSNMVVFGFASLAQAFYPWYSIWGLPYAVTRERVLTTLLIGLPLVSALLDTNFHSTSLGVVMIVAVCFALIAVLVLRFNQRLRLNSRVASS
jgi:hypothetical protein